MDAGDGRNGGYGEQPQYGGYIDIGTIFRSAFIPALFFVIGFILGRVFR
jgi:hypothetical protein